jgi:hypothetical protein
MQISATIPEELQQEIADLAQSETRSFSEMVCILLKESLKVWQKSAAGRNRRKS